MRFFVHNHLFPLQTFESQLEQLSMKRILPFLLLVVSNIALARECNFSSSPKIISQLENELHQFWLTEERDVFKSSLMPKSPQLNEYLSELKSRVKDTNPYTLLAKEYNDFMNSRNPELIAEAINMDLARNKTAGVLYPMNCLEALLLNQQIERGLSWDRPMEFSAFVLKKTVSGKSYLKIYYSTNDRPGGKLNSQVVDLIQTDVTDGWKLFNHLHNHTFNTSAPNNITLVGAPSPSLTDVALYRDFFTSIGLKSASVTNGFDTLHIDSNDFYIFQIR